MSKHIFTPAGEATVLFVKGAQVTVEFPDYHREEFDLSDCFVGKSATSSLKDKKEAQTDTETCSYCNGKGTINESEYDVGQVCPNCDGVGVVPATPSLLEVAEASDGQIIIKHIGKNAQTTPCEHCNGSGQCVFCIGTGEKNGETCDNCGGEGTCGHCDGTGKTAQRHAQAGLDVFWVGVDAMLDRIVAEQPNTFDGVVAVLEGDYGYDYKTYSGTTRPFFPGGGGDRSLKSALESAGWTTVWADASYYYCMRHSATGETLTYMEGDVRRGDTRVVQAQIRVLNEAPCRNCDGSGLLYGFEPTIGYEQGTPEGNKLYQCPSCGGEGWVIIDPEGGVVVAQSINDLNDFHPSAVEQIPNRYQLVFENPEYTGGLFAFPCDANGNVHSLNPQAQANYDMVTANPTKYRALGVENSGGGTYRSDAWGKCPIDGTEVILSDGLENFCDQGHCYNMSGQRVMSRDEWEAAGGESLAGESWDERDGSKRAFRDQFSLGRIKTAACGAPVSKFTNGGREYSVACGTYEGGRVTLCDSCEAKANASYPQGWVGYPGDTCPHGTYVGGSGADYMCGECESGDRTAQAYEVQQGQGGSFAVLTIQEDGYTSTLRINTSEPNALEERLKRLEEAGRKVLKVEKHAQVGAAGNCVECSNPIEALTEFPGPDGNGLSCLPCYEQRMNGASWATQFGLSSQEVLDAIHPKTAQTNVVCPNCGSSDVATEGMISDIGGNPEFAQYRCNTCAHSWAVTDTGFAVTVIGKTAQSALATSMGYSCPNCNGLIVDTSHPDGNVKCDDCSTMFATCENCAGLMKTDGWGDTLTCPECGNSKQTATSWPLV
jgi:transposase-like protein